MVASDPAEDRLVRPPFSRSLAISGSGNDVYKTRFRIAVQADDPRPVVVHYSAAADDAYIHRYFRKYCPNFDGWAPKGTLLFVWYHCLELLLGLPAENVRDLQRKFCHFRKGLFPSPRRARFDRYFKFDQIRDQTWVVSRFLRVLFC